jgi:hypothetical protein
LISTLIEASIENFGLKNDDLLINEERVVTVPNKALKKDAETQINEYDIRDKTKSNCTTQFGYLERLTSELMYFFTDIEIIEILKHIASILRKSFS